MTIDEIYADFELLDDWEDRYRYLIELGRSLEPLPDSERTPENKVQGCVSQVWLWSRTDMSGGIAKLKLVGDSDAHIVRGLIAVVIALFSDRPAAEAAGIDTEAAFRRLGLDSHLTPQRSNGLHAMVRRIKDDAAALSAAPQT